MPDNALRVRARAPMGRKPTMDIAARLRSYDGKRVAPFRAVAEAVRDAPEVPLGHLLDLAASEEMQLQVGATWVLKHLAERGTVPRGEQAAELVDLLGRAAAPDATLHVLQTLQYIDIPGGRERVLKRELLTLVRSKRAFLRAWAYNGLGVLAARDPAIRAEVTALFDRAVEKEGAAVRARIRRARKAF